jgi:putative sterol carrier protein
VLAVAKAVADPTAAFFAELATRSDEPLLRKASGATRFDIVDGRRVRRWYLDVDNGRLSVATKPSAGTTCVIRADKAVFDRIAAGKLNAVAAVLRGELTVDGDWRLLVRLQRLFPSPPRRRARRT